MTIVHLLDCARLWAPTEGTLSACVLGRESAKRKGQDLHRGESPETHQEEKAKPHRAEALVMMVRGPAWTSGART